MRMCRIPLVAVFALCSVVAYSAADELPATKETSKTGEVGNCRITVENAAADIDDSPREPTATYPDPFLANVTITFDNSDAGKPISLTITKGAVRDSTGKDYQVVWLDPATGKPWDGKAPAGEKATVTFFARLKPEPKSPAMMIVQVQGPDESEVWLRSEPVPVHLLK